MTARSLFVALALGLAVDAHAAHPLITEDTGTQGRGRWQLEVNGERSRLDAGGRVGQGAATLSYGALDTVDLQLTGGFAEVRDVTTPRGALDTALDLKWRFFEHEALSLALKPGVTLPTAKSGLGGERATWGSLFIASYERDFFALHAHAGYRRNRNAIGERTSLRHVSASLWLKPTEALKLVVDRSRDTNPDPADSRAIRQSIVGAIYGITKDFDVDVGWRRTHGPAGERAAMAGVALRW